MKIIRTISLCLLAGSTVGCATVTRGTTEDVVINYQPSDANVSTDIGYACKASPCVLNIERKKAFTVTASKPGYETKSVYVGTKVAGQGAAGLAGNILIGGVVGAGVDVATGAARDHTPNPVNIQLVPKGSQRSTPAAKPNSPSAPSVPVS
ncbi:translation initiation factor 2 [Pseudahrensia aquimaris]|uniref:Translation initiation factor 2 n=1 Tax=Pseudahrensia aquimaris TaxID=744461 RepID=A0ABW3FHB7_9HYPH